MDSEAQSVNNYRDIKIDDDSISKEIRIMILDVLKFCPFRLNTRVNLNNLPIVIKRDEDGWCFKCYDCSDSLCSGFIKDKIPS